MAAPLVKLALPGAAQGGERLANHEHSDQRLIGAPPGYVGFEEGGQLTNAIRERPFSVLLFDEIEKAHPRILDKFLQILEDGRLTDGRGETAYFSECVIIFTSNLGSSEMPAGGDGELVRAHFLKADSLRLARERPPLDFKDALLGIAAPFMAADDA